MNFSLASWTKHIKLVLAALSTAIAVLGSQTTSAQLPQVPVYLKEPVAPNLLLTVDNSGSMAWAYVPDVPAWRWPTVGQNDPQGFVHPAILAVSQNPLAYNPNVVYAPPQQADGTLRSVTYTAALRYGLLPNIANVTVQAWAIPAPWTARATASANSTPTNAIDLSTQFRPTVQLQVTNVLTEAVFGNVGGAYYTRLVTATDAQCPVINAATPGCYQNILMNNATAAQQQNFANWFSFYRTRHLSLKTGMMRALFDLDNTTRVSWQSLPAEGGGGTVDRCKLPGVGTGTCPPRYFAGANFDNQLAPLTATKRASLFQWLAELESDTSTPLRRPFADVLTYTQQVGLNNPWGNTPGTQEAPINQCRATFHVAITDGLWNGGIPAAAQGNFDNVARTLPDTRAYAPAAPYSDAVTDTLADLAFRAWATDASTAAPNTVTPYAVTDLPPTSLSWSNADYWNPRNDPATWQHVNTFTIGLGLGSFLTQPAWDGSTYASNTPNSGFAPFQAGTANWGTAGAAGANAGPVYDLWHAAVNGRGEFFSADRPQDIYNAFQSIFGRIAGRSGSASGSAANSNYIDSDTAVYSATYKTGEWSGEVVRTAVNSDGSLGSEIKSSEPGKIPVHTSRNIFSRESNLANAAAVDFKWVKMLASAKSAMTNNSLDASMLDYYRGDRSFEDGSGLCGGNAQPACKFRRRGNLIGDILGSGPVYVRTQDFGYRSAIWPIGSGAGKEYLDYLVTKKSSTGIVLVGANDGMLHGFDPLTLEEKFAYVPSAVFGKLWRLTEAAYVKQAFVDGPIGIGDAYIGGWKTYALVTLGAGGQSVSALDVSPGVGYGPTMLKWEFTDPDFGFLLSKPVIARMDDGTWVAVFSGGYEAPTKKARLYVVNLASGALIQKIAFDDLSAPDACGATRPQLNNGLGGVSVSRTKSGAIRVYAGDLYGRLWRLKNPAGTNTLTVDYAGAPLLKACNSQNVAQPITAAPAVDALGAEHIVYVGTGKMLVAGDSANTDVQSFYGVIADNTTPATTARNVRLGQRTTQTYTAGTETARTVSTNKINLVNQRGWFVDLADTRERVTAPASIVDGRVVFATFTPEFTGCLSDGNSWAFNLDGLDGAGPSSSLFDINNDGKLDANDKVNNQFIAAVRLVGTITGFSTLKRNDRAGDPTVNAGGGTGSAAADVCGRGKVKLIANRLYEKGTSNFCTPSATLRSGWRQLR
jgi:type IV pilus assembly protein PilY1